MVFWEKLKKLFQPIDLTKGSIVKDMIVFAIPIVLSMIFQLLYTMTDTIVVGQTLSDNAIAGIGDASSLVFIVLDFAWGCTSGFSVIISKKIGEGDDDGVRKSLLVQIILSLILTVVLTAIGLLSIDAMLAWIHIVPSATDSTMQEVYQAAHDYLFIIFLGIFAQMGYNLITSDLRAMGDSFAPFVFLVIGTLLNIVLDICFIVVFHWGVAGTAWATVITQALSGLATWLYAFHRYKKLKITRQDWNFSLAYVWEHLKNGLPLGFNFSILAIGIIIMQSAVISFDITPSGTAVVGVPAQVGFSVASKLMNILMSPLNALGAVMISFTGQNYGAKKYDRIADGVKKSFILGLFSYLIVAIIGLLLTIGGAYQYAFLAKSKITAASIAYGNTYLYVSVPMLFLLMLLFIGRNTLQGLEKPLFPFIAGIGELLARSLVCLFLPSLVNGGPINSASGLLPFAMTSAADPMAWFFASCLLILPLIHYLRQLSHPKITSKP